MPETNLETYKLKRKTRDIIREKERKSNLIASLNFK